MLAMEGADKERNRLFLAKYTHIHNTRPSSKAHYLMLAMDQSEQKRRETYKLLLVKHTHIHNTRLLSKTHILMLAMEQADKERKQVISGQTYTHTQHKTIQ